jgi:hypothetical protein
MKKILSFKSWMLFLLIALPLAWVSPDYPSRQIINLIGVSILLAWIFAIGSYGQEKIRDGGLVSMDLKFFKLCTVIAWGLIVFRMLFLHPYSPDAPIMIRLLTAVITVGFIAAFCYVIFFAGKTLAKIEYKREVSIGDYILTIILFLIPFIGVWVLQPKVNKLIAVEPQVQE